MPGTPTPILGLVNPTVGGDTSIWGTELNGNNTIIDALGSAPVVNVSAAYTATRPTFPEMVLRVTTAGLNIPITLPSPSLVTGKIYTVIKVDSGLGNVQVIGPINDLTEWDLSNQYTYVRLYSNGSSFDVIGG